MKYLTGPIIFYTPYKLNSGMKFGISDVMNDEYMWYKEAEGSILGEYDIYDSVALLTRPTQYVRAAGHIRAYFDILMDKKFDYIRDWFYDVSKCIQVQGEIFKVAYALKLYEDEDIMKFLLNEFGNLWENYVSQKEEMKWEN